MNDPKQLTLDSNRFKLHIGIDPDLRESGISVWDCEQRKLTTCTKMRFYTLIKFVCKYSKADVKIHISAGWLSGTKFFHEAHIRKSMPERVRKGSPAAQQRYINGVSKDIAIKVGKNHAVGELLLELLNDIGYNAITYWTGEAKWTPEYFTMITGIKTKNQELIDSGQIVIGR